jgi:hypothetical protein
MKTDSRIISVGVALGTLVTLASAPAAAITTEEDEGVTPHEQARPTAGEATMHVLPNTVAADAGNATGVGAAWGGYDGGMHAPVAVFKAEVRVLPRLVLMGGAGWSVPNALGQGGGSMRPQIGARFQILDQQRHDIDLSVAVGFREDRFGAEDGMFQGTLAAGRRFGRTAVVVNGVFGTDGEGDDHEGEVRLTVLRDVGTRLHLGVDGFGRRSLDSTDPRRTMLGTPVGEAFGGPIAALTLGPVALLAEAGVDGVWLNTVHTGVMTAAGLAAVF